MKKVFPLMKVSIVIFGTCGFAAQANAVFGSLCSAGGNGSACASVFPPRGSQGARFKARLKYHSTLAEIHNDTVKRQNAALEELRKAAELHATKEFGLMPGTRAHKIKTDAILEEDRQDMGEIPMEEHSHFLDHWSSDESEDEHSPKAN